MMSLFATPSRNAEKELHNSKQLHYLADPEEPLPADTGPVESPAGKVASLDEVARVERLLTQLEARSMALVPYNYANLREVPAPKANRVLIACSLLAIWLGTLAVAVTYSRFANQPPPIAQRAPVTTSLVISSAPDLREQKVTSSVDQLAKALVTSSERLNQLEAAIQRSNRDLQDLTTNVNSERAKAGSTLPKAEPARTVAPPLATLVAPPPAAPFPTPFAVNIAEGASPRQNQYRLLETKPTDAAIPHKGDDGTIDYWLVARSANKAPEKVLPIAVSADGVVVYNLEDGKNYTLTHLGEWRDAEW
jgi:hypothetical protein